jgi:hypothetical protein
MVKIIIIILFKSIKMKFTSILLGLVPITNAEVWLWCPDVRPVENFDYYKFAGNWYEIYQDWLHKFGSDKECKEHFYAPTSYGF